MFAVLLPAEFVPDICWYLSESMAESRREELEEQTGESQPWCPPAATQPGSSPPTPALNQLCRVSSLSGRFSPKHLFDSFLKFANPNSTECACREEKWMQTTGE